MATCIQTSNTFINPYEEPAKPLIHSRVVKCRGRCFGNNNYNERGNGALIVWLCLYDAAELQSALILDEFIIRNPLMTCAWDAC